MNPIQIDLHTLAALYGPALYILQGDEPASNAVASTPRVEAVPVAQAETPLAQRDTPGPEQPAPTPPGITWRPKPSSQVLFICHATDLRDPALGELLKKIVASIGIPFESAGFGLISGPVNREEFETMPNPYGVVFDQDLLPPGSPNPVSIGDKEVFFAHRLSSIEQDKNQKQSLWNYLKTLKPKIA